MVINTDSSSSMASTRMAPGSASLGPNQGSENKELIHLFGVIDKLRECGISEEISLPQICVFGDQSSGKSSCLEALTTVPFPIAGTLCTRFATQINFRKAPDERVTVSIIPSREADDEKHKLLSGFVKTMKELDAKSFETILGEASEAMGLPRPGEVVREDQQRFSDDVLKIELCGPGRPHFSVVDIPGLFQCATANQTLEDAALVNKIVKKYMNEPRTIILAVASSLHEIANQIVFRLAEEADPNGLRTVGLLTKPDAVQPGDEDRVLDVASNRVTHLRHGWFVIRNRSTEEVNNGVTMTERKKTEQAFFKQGRWRVLDRSRVGIDALETYLRKLLFEQIRKEYPALVRELNNRLEECRRDISALGPPRENAHQQRALLTNLSNTFHSIARNAVLGYYDPELVKFEELRLRTNIRNRTDAFSKEMRDKGHLYDLEEGYTDEIQSWIETICNQTRGCEMEGMVNPQTLQCLFRLQTGKWEDIAGRHICHVRDMVADFNRVLLQQKCAQDDELRRRIWRTLQPTFSYAERKAFKELDKVLADERGDVLITLNPDCVKTRDYYRCEHLSQDLEDAKNASAADENSGKDWAVDTYLALKKSTIHVNRDVFEFLRAYYSVALSRFIDCVCLQVIERHYMGKKGPPRAFSPALVGEMSPEELHSVAGEDVAAINEQRLLITKLESLEKAKDVVSVGYI